MTPERFHRLRNVLLRRQLDLTVLMDGVSKSHNFSAILRNCDAAGVRGVHVVPPRHGLPLHNAASAGTRKWVNVQGHGDVASAIGHLKEEGFTVVAAHPSPDALDYRDVDYTTPVAITMGAELYGVSEEALRLSDHHVVVPMLGMVHSLNVSVATSILLFEALRQRQAAGMYDESKMPQDEFERTLFEWAYPTIARNRRRASRPYPDLSPDGELIRGS